MLRRFAVRRPVSIVRVLAVLAVAAVGMSVALSATAGANTRGSSKLLAKLPPQARSAVLRNDTVKGKKYLDGLGIAPGKIKHVWLIILENKSYDASFTGLNNNTYLWKTLPSQGVELKNYYGTGHDSLDNYLSMTSG
jgi:phospholipase C